MLLFVLALLRDQALSSAGRQPPTLLIRRGRAALATDLRRRPVARLRPFFGLATVFALLWSRRARRVRDPPAC
jgi:hypothetical protein